MTEELWTFGAIAPEGSERIDIDGFTLVEADGEEAGRVVEATYEPGSSCVVIEAGPWLVGRRVLLPAGLISGMDPENETNRAHEGQVKESPTSNPDLGDITSQQHRHEVARYFEAFSGPSMLRFARRSRTLKPQAAL
jgi:hypothetical protein